MLLTTTRVYRLLHEASREKFSVNVALQQGTQRLFRYCWMFVCKPSCFDCIAVHRSVVVVEQFLVQVWSERSVAYPSLGTCKGTPVYKNVARKSELSITGVCIRMLVIVQEEEFKGGKGRAGHRTKKHCTDRCTSYCCGQRNDSSYCCG